MTDKDSVARVADDLQRLLGLPHEAEPLWQILDRLRALPQPEPLNLSCKSVQKRLAAQWGFVHPDALSQPGEVTEGMAIAGLRAYGVDEPNEYQIGRMRAALSEALGAQTRGEGELLGYLYADDQRNLRQSGMAVIYEKKQIFHLTPKQSCIPVFAASPDQQKGDA